MDKVKYEEKMKNTIMYGLSEYHLQNIINILRKNNIARYKNGEEDKNVDDDGKVLIDSKESKADRIIKCMQFNKNTYYEIEKYIIEKSYRYAIYYKLYKYDINKDNIEGLIEIDSMNGNLKISDYSSVRYDEDDDKIIFIFYKEINLYVEELDRSVLVLYPTLWIIHKNLNILEHRFDILTFRKDDEFYKTTFMPQLNILESRFNIIDSEFRTSEVIKYITDNKKDEVYEISQYVGLKGNSSAKLKVGENLVMPFIGEIELILEENKDLFECDEKTKKIKDILNEYISSTKRNANYKSRLLSWVNKDNKVFLSVNVMFSYKNNNYDIFNFLEPKKIIWR